MKFFQENRNIYKLEYYLRFSDTMEDHFPEELDRELDENPLPTDDTGEIRDLLGRVDRGFDGSALEGLALAGAENRVDNPTIRASNRKKDQDKDISYAMSVFDDSYSLWSKFYRRLCSLFDKPVDDSLGRSNAVRALVKKGYTEDDANMLFARGRGEPVSHFTEKEIVYKLKEGQEYGEQVLKSNEMVVILVEPINEDDLEKYDNSRLIHYNGSDWFLMQRVKKGTLGYEYWLKIAHS